MPNFEQKDRDLLIKHDVKLAQVCSSINKLDKKMDKIVDKIDDNVKTFVTTRMFSIVITILFVLICGSYAYTMNTII